MKIHPFALMLTLLVFLATLLLSCDDPTSSNGDESSERRTWTTVELSDTYYLRIFPHEWRAGVVYMTKTDSSYRDYLLKSEDSGETWETVLEGFETDQVLFTHEDPEIIYLQGDYPELNETQYPRLWISLDGGRTIDTVSNHFFGESETVWVDPLDKNHLWASSGSIWEMQSLSESTDGGKTWSAIHEEYFASQVSTQPRRVRQILFDLDMPQHLLIVAVKPNSTIPAEILASDDNFASFQVIHSTDQSYLSLSRNELDPDEFCYLQRGSTENVMVISRDGGQSWTEEELQLPDSPTVGGVQIHGDSLYALADNELWVSGSDLSAWSRLKEFPASQQISWKQWKNDILYVYDASANSLYVYK